jgi:hypothetical protein
MTTRNKILEFVKEYYQEEFGSKKKTSKKGN